MRLLLVGPPDPEARGRHSKRSHHLGLAQVAALASATFDEIRLVEENYERLDLEQPADLVGVSMMTCQAPRAYEIADHFRRRAVPTLAGGVHASFMSAEALEHFDAVVVDEAETSWGEVERDFLAGRLAGVYQGRGAADLSALPMPRKDLFRGSATFNLQVLQTSRGCPLGCDFCTVTRMYGAGFRTRPIDQIVEEIRRFPAGLFFIVDDNVFFSKPHAYALCEALLPLGIRWGSQGALAAVAGDRDLLRLAARSGCVSLFVGIESLDQDLLTAAGKRFNRVDRYEQQIKALHDAGIMVIGAFIFGFERNTTDEYARVLEFAGRTGLGVINSGILTPFPGSRVYERMERDGLIVDRDWSHYTGNQLVWRHPIMAKDAIERADWEMVQRFYSWRSIAARLRSNWRHPLYYLGVNAARWWEFRQGFEVAGPGRRRDGQWPRG